MIVVTGAAGFIGSNFVNTLIKAGYKDIVCTDLKEQLSNCEYIKSDTVKKIEAFDLPNFIHLNHRLIQIIVHMGANSDTTNPDKSIYEKLNLNYSKDLWKLCVIYGLPIIYASSASTYGDGSFGYDDCHSRINRYEPLNNYAWSKQEFDKWALKQDKKPFFWVGLKFFNVYGPNENHKGKMASVIYKSFHSILKKDFTCLFKSHHPKYSDGAQTRDFVYVKDVCDVMLFFMETRAKSGLYNVGTGIGRSFLDLAKSTFKAMQKEPKIKFIDTPVHLRDKYQYFTEANISKLRNIGYSKPFHSLEDGVRDYVEKYLAKDELIQV